MVDIGDKYKFKHNIPPAPGPINGWVLIENLFHHLLN